MRIFFLGLLLWAHIAAASVSITGPLSVSGGTVEIGQNVAAPFSQFTVSTNTAITNTFITFTDTSLNAPFTSTTWIFGDGSSSASGSVVSHQYTWPGRWIVTETVSSLGGTSSSSQTIYIALPVAVAYDFTGTVGTLVTPALLTANAVGASKTIGAWITTNQSLTQNFVHGMFYTNTAWSNRLQVSFPNQTMTVPGANGASGVSFVYTNDQESCVLGYVSTHPTNELFTWYDAMPEENGTYSFADHFSCGSSDPTYGVVYGGGDITENFWLGWSSPAYYNTLEYTACVNLYGQNGGGSEANLQRSPNKLYRMVLYRDATGFAFMGCANPVTDTLQNWSTNYSTRTGYTGAGVGFGHMSGEDNVFTSGSTISPVPPPPYTQIWQGGTTYTSLTGTAIPQVISMAFLTISTNTPAWTTAQLITLCTNGP